MRPALVVAAATLASCLNFAPCRAVADEQVVVAPRVTRPPAAGEAALWPYCGAESGGSEIRNCGWWRDGWEVFVDKIALPAVERHGRLWLHNPGGVVTGEPMKFQQLSECAQQATLSGDKTLRAVSDLERFTAQMSRVAGAGELAIYLGNPTTMPLRDGESDEEWLARAAAELAPILAIEPNPIIGLDATYGQPADPSRAPWDRFGGERGLVARVVQLLVDSGHEVVVEPAILRSAPWLRDRAGTIATDWFWDTQYKDRDAALPCYVRAWGKYYKPSELRGRQVRMYTQLHREPLERRRAVLQATLDAGYDAVYGLAGFHELRERTDSEAPSPE